MLKDEQVPETEAADIPEPDTVEFEEAIEEAAGVSLPRVTRPSEDETTNVETSGVAKVPDLEERESELRDALEFAKKVGSGEIVLSPAEWELAEVASSTRDLESKLAAIESLRKAQENLQEIEEHPEDYVTTPEEYRSAVESYSKHVVAVTSPFAKHTDEGVSFDIAAALKAYGEEALREEMGIPQTKIVRAKRDIQTRERWEEVESEAARLLEEGRTKYEQYEAELGDFEARLHELPRFLQDAYTRGGVEAYNAAVAEYNDYISTARAAFPPEGETYFISEELAQRARSGEFATKYAAMLQPGNMTDAEYSQVKPFVKPWGFDFSGAEEEGVPDVLLEKFLGVNIERPPTAFTVPEPAKVEDLVARLPQRVQRVYDEFSPEEKFALLRAYGQVPLNAAYQGSTAEGEPTWVKSGLEAVVDAVVFPDDPWRFPLLAGAAATALPALFTPLPAITLPMAITKIPLIPRIAIGLGTLILRTTPATYTAAAVSEAVQANNVVRKWQAFQGLDDRDREKIVRQAGYRVPYEELTEGEKANVLLHYSAPPGYSLSEWQGTLAEKADEALAFVNKGSEWIREHAPAVVSEPIAFAGGTVVGALAEAPIYTAMLPTIAAQLVDKVPEGSAKEYAAAVALGFAAFFTSEIRSGLRTDPSTTSGRLVGLFLIGPTGILRLAQGLGARLNVPKYVHERGMAVEHSVVRVSTEGLSELEVRTAMERAIEALLEGPEGADAVKGRFGQWYVDVPVGDGLHRLRVLGTAYPKFAPHTVFSATPNIRTFDPANPGRLILWSSPHLARRFAIMSASGERMTHPGVVETYLGPEGFKKLPKRVATAKDLNTMAGLALRAYRRGVRPGEYPPFKEYMSTIELEATSIGPWEAVRGPGGEGVSADVAIGSYPIFRYVLKGLGLEGYRGLSAEQLRQINANARIDALLDFFLGWKGRMDALKRLTSSDEYAQIPELRDFIRNEGFLSELAELIHGRRRAVRIYKDPEVLKRLKRFQEMGYVEAGAYADYYARAYQRALELAIARGAPRTEVREREFDVIRELIGRRGPTEREPAPSVLEYRGPYEEEYTPPLRFLEEPIIEERAEERVEERAEERVEERVEERPEERVEERVEERPEERVEERPEERVEERPEEPVEEEPPPPGGLPGESRPEMVKVPPGTIVWRQGEPFGKEQIKYIPPPWNQPKPDSLLGQRPEGYVDKGRTPAETIQMIGVPGTEAPTDIYIDLGIADVHVFRRNGKYQIRFLGYGTRTDVGLRIPGPTKGMSVADSDKPRRIGPEVVRIPDLDK